MKFSYISKNAVKTYYADFGFINRFRKAAIIPAVDSYYFRKVYPRVDIKDLPEIVKNDEFNVYVENPGLKYRIRETVESGHIVDIWIFDRTVLEGKSFDYVVPEPGMFYSSDLEISVYRDVFQEELLHIVAHDSNGYISSAYLSPEEFSEEFDIFLRSVKRFGEIKAINLFTDIKNFNTDQNIQIKRIHRDDLPAFILKTDKKIIKQFREPLTLPFDTEQILKSSAVFLLSLSAVSYFNLREYQQQTQKIEEQIHEIDSKIDALMKKVKKEGSDQELSSILNILRKEMEIDTLKILEHLLMAMPEKDYVVMYSQEEYKLRLSVNSKDPVKTIKSLSSVKSFDSIRMATAPVKQQDGSFNILLDIDLRNTQDE